MNKEAIGPGRAWHGGKPVVAHGKFPRERDNHRDLLWGIAFHDLARIGRVDRGIIRHESAIVDVGKIPLDPAELHLDIVELVPGIVGHCPVGGRRDCHLISMRVEVPITGQVQSLDSGRLPCDSIDAL